MTNKVVNPQNVYALVVGIEKSDPTKWSNLDGSANDAIKFAKWLYDQKVPPGNIHLCLSSLDPEHDLELPSGVSRQLATYQTVFEILTKLTSTQGEIFFLFWVGHGVIKNKTRRLFC